MTKSLEDIMRQMEVQRAAEQQTRFAEERALNEQRERQRREHLERIRIYESSNFNNSSAAAGAGGGRRKDCSINEYVVNDYICNYFE